MNMDDLKDYAGMKCILEPWNPPTLWRHVSYLTMSNFNAYRHKLKEFQRWPLSLLNVQRRWIMTLVMGLLEDVPWHFKRVSTNILLMGMVNDYNEIAWWMLMKNVDDIKHYAWTTCNLEPWNQPTPWRHVSYLTMSNFDAYKHKLKEFQRWPLPLHNVRCRWIMASMMGLLEDVPWALKISHTVKACVLSNHVKFRRIHAQVEEISMLAPFTAQRVKSVDNGIGDGLVGRRSMTFQESFDK